MKSWSIAFFGFVAVMALACSNAETNESGASEPASGGEITLSPSPTASGGACATDADCVPAACCHADACVARAAAPACAGVACTLDCRENTIDCGGGCFCQNGQCAARMGGI